MAIEIRYDKTNCSLYYRHDEINYSLKEIEEHIRNNGHGREIISIVVPNMSLMNEARKSKKEISDISDKKLIE